MNLASPSSLCVLCSPLQVLFLLYHYYNAKEIYNAIRVFIAAYVWMTGFGEHCMQHPVQPALPRDEILPGGRAGQPRRRQS